MELILEKIYKQSSVEAYCYFAEYVGDSLALAACGENFVVIEPNNIVQITCEKDSVPTAKLSGDDFSNVNYDGKISGAGIFEDAKQFLNNYFWRATK